MKKKKKEILENNKESVYQYINVKDNFLKICREQNFYDLINDMSIRTNDIIRKSNYFLKLYLTYLFENNDVFPVIDLTLFRYIYTFVSTINSNRVTKTNMQKIVKFNDEIFSKLDLNKTSRDGLTNILSYESEIIITNIENNIKEHFYKHFSKYVNILFSYLEKKEKIKNEKITEKEKKEKTTELNKLMYELKTQILSQDKITNKKYEEFIKKVKKELFSNISNIHKNGVMYDIKIQPQKYLYSLFKIIKYYENENEKNKNTQIKLFSILPMRSTLIPRHITIDTEIIIQNFKNILKDNLFKIDKTLENIEELRTNFGEKNLHHKIWNVIFNMKRKLFKEKRKHKFDFILKTNGIACSVQFKLKNSMEKKVNVVKNKIESTNKYIENNRFSILGKKNVVCIDPNKRDLIYSGMYKNNKFVNYRYTQNQRRVETKSKKYKKIRNLIENKKKIKWTNEDEQILKEHEKLMEKIKEKIKENKSKTKEKELLNEENELKKEEKKIKDYEKEVKIHENESIKSIELLKTNYGIKGVNMEKIKENIKKTEKINTVLKKTYELEIYRKLEWNGYINRAKSESKMIKDFGKKMGKKDEVIVIVGDYSINSSNMKGTLPAISKRIITILKKNGYEVNLISEYNTSKLCNECGEKLEKFHKRKSSKPKRKGKEEEVHGLLRCQSLKCKIIHNRDKNAVKNMLKIVKNIKNTGNRQKEYCREIKLPCQSALAIPK